MGLSLFKGLERAAEQVAGFSLPPPPSPLKLPALPHLRGERAVEGPVIAVENPHGSPRPGAPSFYGARVGTAFLVFNNPTNPKLGPLTDVSASKMRQTLLPGGLLVCTQWRIESFAAGELIDRVRVDCCARGKPEVLVHELAAGAPLCPQRTLSLG